MTKSRKKIKPRRQKWKLISAQRRARCERKRNFRMIFINGRQKWVPREPLIDGLTVNEFIARNADPICWCKRGFTSCCRHVVRREGCLKAEAAFCRLQCG